MSACICKHAMDDSRCPVHGKADPGMGGDALGQRDIRCSDCRQTFGKQHLPHCHRQGIVTTASDYRDRRDHNREMSQQ
jgi:hypothetical protein